MDACFLSFFYPNIHDLIIFIIFQWVKGSSYTNLSYHTLTQHSTESWTEMYHLVVWSTTWCRYYISHAMMVLPGIFSALWLQTKVRPQALDSINRKVDWHFFLSTGRLTIHITGTWIGCFHIVIDRNKCHLILIRPAEFFLSSMFYPLKNHKWGCH